MKRATQNAVIAIVAVLISLAVVEVYLRLNAPQAVYAIRYCYLGWCHVPGVSFVHGGETGEFVTNVEYNLQAGFLSTPLASLLAQSSGVQLRLRSKRFSQ